jgi:exosortase A
MAAERSVGGGVSAAVAALGCVALLAIFRDTTASLVHTWWNSETYTHGLLILPISIWLVWRRRAELRGLPARPAPAVLVLFAGAAAVWALAALVGVRVGEQLALVSMLGLLVWAVLGHRLARQLAFPLLFLFLAVPMGQDLVPPMMEFTATFTVNMLQLTGIPVYREGLYFVVPSGAWSIVEACSGVRYLIASVTLGVLYAYLSYRSLWRRAVFVALSVVVPVFANGLRAYIIVMIGHLSDMKLAVGVDHLIYGWVFFGIVMLLLFWVGSWWSEPVAHRPATGLVGAAAAAPSMAAKSWGHFAVAAAALGLAWLAAEGKGALVDQQSTVVAAFEAPAGVGGWAQVRELPADWAPRTLDSGYSFAATYARTGETVRVYVTLYPAQRQDAEAVNSLNQVVDERDSGWRVTARRKHAVTEDGTLREVNVFELARGATGSTQSEDTRLLLWHWYRLGTHATADAYKGKLLAAINLLHPGRTDGAYLVIGTSAGSGPDEATEVLQAFVDDMLPELDRAIDAAVIGPALR